jgi:hypothetical protein
MNSSVYRPFPWLALLMMSLLLIPTYAVTPTATPTPDILDIRPPLHLEEPFPWLAWSAGSAALLALAWAAWTLRRRSVLRKPWELALEQLAQTRALMDETNAEPFSRAVSEVVRGFIEESFPLRAAHRTTDEFLRDVAGQPEHALVPHREMLAAFLRQCDLAKFARWSLTRHEMEAMLEAAGAFVLAVAQPRPAAPSVAAHAVPVHS